jgi:DnaJ-domain-containing protein 1
MTSIEEFIAARMSIEALAGKIALSVENNAVQDSREHLEEAGRQLEILKAMVANDVQVIVAGRLSRQLGVLGVKVTAKIAKMPAKRKAAAEKKTPTKAVRASKPRKAVAE